MKKHHTGAGWGLGPGLGLIGGQVFHRMPDLGRSYHLDGTVPQPLPTTILVFGSNLGGVHGAGAAAIARKLFDAQHGSYSGRSGRAYAIPTKDIHLRPLPLRYIRTHARRFVEYTQAHPELRFFVTRVGCGLAGNRDQDMAPMFDSAVNCSFPLPWSPYLPHNK